MIESGKVQNTKRTKQNKFLISLLFAAVMLNSLHDINQLREFTSGLANRTLALIRTSEFSTYASKWAVADSSCSQSTSSIENSVDQPRWSEPVAPRILKIKRHMGNVSADNLAVHELVAREIATATKRVHRGRLTYLTIQLPNRDYGRGFDSEVKEETKQ